MDGKMDRQWSYLISLMHQYGAHEGLLAGLTALIRGAYESEGLKKALLDAALCCVIGTFVFKFPGLEQTFNENPNGALIAAIVIGVIGANLIITTIRESFVAAVKRLNPATWFRKTR